MAAAIVQHQLRALSIWLVNRKAPRGLQDIPSAECRTRHCLNCHIRVVKNVSDQSLPPWQVLLAVNRDEAQMGR